MDIKKDVTICYFTGYEDSSSLDILGNKSSSYLLFLGGGGGGGELVKIADSRM